MSDWSKIELCFECGAGNPAGGETCINCSIDLQQARARLLAIREQNFSQTIQNRRPRGKRNNKPIDELTISDLKRFPVWEFDLENEGLPGRDETWVKPVKDLPVADLSNQIIGTLARLASGKLVYCLLANIELQHQRKTTQFLCLTVFKEDDDCFSLARYFDIDYEENGPDALASYLEMPVEEVFPITYDISKSAIGLESVVKGLIQKEISEKLSDEERLELIFS